MPGLICHVDMDAFFAALEVRACPALKGKPVVVGGGPPGREVVTTASYPARAFGIRSGMSLRRARTLCPGAVFLPVDPPKYISASRNLIGIFERFTPGVELASIDEVFLDFTPLALEDEEECLDTGRRIKKAVLEEEGLTCSIGLGPNKLQARMATRLLKPDGLVLLGAGDFERIFWPRPVRDLWGIGPETAAVLGRLGLRTIGDLAGAGGHEMSRIMGTAGRVLVSMARGNGGGDISPLPDGPPARSMGHEITFSRDETEIPVLERHLLLLCDRLARRLRREGYSGHVIQIRLKRSDQSVITRQSSLAHPTDEDRIIWTRARKLLHENHDGGYYRLIGVSVSHLITGAGMIPLWPQDLRNRTFNGIRDRVRNRFGESSLFPAGTLPLFRWPEGSRLSGKPARGPGHE